MENSEDESSININQYKVLTKNNWSVLRELIQMTIQSFESYKSEFRNLITNRDKKETGLLAHKLKTTIVLLEAKFLDQSIKAARKLLEEEADHNTIEAAIQKIEEEFDNCSKDLEKELNLLS
jgi:HPt (histidine-containing phosphotransfer) domain-containing protein